MADPQPQSELRPIDRDLHCPECEYNLRGLSGDPVQCPECGACIAVARLVPSPKLMEKRVRALESSGTIAFFCASFFMFALVAGVNAGEVCPLFGCAVLALLWVGAAVQFRRDCRRAPGWFEVFLKNHAYWAAIFVPIVVVGGACGFVGWRAVAALTDDNSLTALSVITGIVIGAAILIWIPLLPRLNRRREREINELARYAVSRELEAVDSKR
jgi:hypothetical protein